MANVTFADGTPFSAPKAAASTVLGYRVLAKTEAPRTVASGDAFTYVGTCSASTQIRLIRVGDCASYATAAQRKLLEGIAVGEYPEKAEETALLTLLLPVIGRTPVRIFGTMGTGAVRIKEDIQRAQFPVILVQPLSADAESGGISLSTLLGHKPLLTHWINKTAGTHADKPVKGHLLQSALESQTHVAIPETLLFKDLLAWLKDTKVQIPCVLETLERVTATADAANLPVVSGIYDIEQIDCGPARYRRTQSERRERRIEPEQLLQLRQIVRSSSPTRGAQAVELLRAWLPPEGFTPAEHRTETAVTDIEDCDQRSPPQTQTVSISGYMDPVDLDNPDNVIHSLDRFFRRFGA